MQTHRIVLSLGSNKGNRKRNIEKSIDLLRSFGIKPLITSSIIKTLPWGNWELEIFMNAALLAETSLKPLELLKKIKQIEKTLGRTSSHMEPREIDIDIIFYDNLVIKTPELFIPHPSFREREFVLKPLHEIIPKFKDPETQKSIETLYKELLQMPYVISIQTKKGQFSVQIRENIIVKSCFCSLRGRKDYNPSLLNLLNLIDKYFKGEPVDFSQIAVDISHLPNTYRKILHKLRELPYGHLITYGELAERAGIHNGARVVGNAMRINPVPVIIPCHRVIRKNGIGNYSSGIEIKEFLLKLELKNRFFDIFTKGS